MRRIFIILLSGIFSIGLVLTSTSKRIEPAAPSPPGVCLVSGVAAVGKPIIGTVSLRDSAVPPRVRRTETRRDGSFSFDVRGLTAPFVLKVEWTEGRARRCLHSLAAGPDTANINPFSDAAVAGAAGTDPALFYAAADFAALDSATANFPAVIDSLRAVTSPLFQLYGTAVNPVTDVCSADHDGLDALFDHVEVVLSAGMIVMMNKETRTYIFSAPLADIPSGSFNEANMPRIAVFNKKKS